jgi:1,5-anhydro-D-fructose reductase (1,5-anhydro-D-mannitol-forming)
MRGRYGKEVNDSFFNGWRANKALAGGGIMLDQGIHMLDLFIYLGAEFDEVQAMVSNLFWNIDGIEDNVFVNLRSKKTGICASLHSTMTQWRYLFSLEIFLEKGALILNGLKTSSGSYGDEDLAIKRNRTDFSKGIFDSEDRIVFHTDTSWASEIKHFFDAIGNNSAISVGTSMDALKVMQLIDSIYASDLHISNFFEI